MSATADTAHPPYEELEACFVNNPELDQIEAYLGRFNPIRVMGMERMEIRHSAILAWLLNPAETHGLDDRFLKTFLAEALRGHSHLGHPTALDVSQWDLRDTEVRCEWQNIDIFLYSEGNKTAFIVENKFDSRQHEGQLAKYRERVAKTYEFQGVKANIRGIFLTLEGEEPADATYATIQYGDICTLLPRFIAEEGALLGADVETFLRHYLEILKDATGMNPEQDEMKKLARKLYRDHRKVLDFVWEYGCDADFSIAAHALFGEETKHLVDRVNIGKQPYRLGWIGNDMASFLPDSWYMALGEREYTWGGCENWWAGYPLIVWFQLYQSSDSAKGQLKLHAEVGPISDYEFRKALIENIILAGKTVNSKRIKFQNSAAEKGKKYSKFFKENTTEVKDVQDSEEIADAMTRLLVRFQPEFDAVAEILPQCRGYAEDCE